MRSLPEHLVIRAAPRGGATAAAPVCDAILRGAPRAHENESARARGPPRPRAARARHTHTSALVSMLVATSGRQRPLPPAPSRLLAPRLLSSEATPAYKTLLLCSGGVESSVLVAQLLDNGRSPVPLFADYSQRGAAAERAAAEAVCASAGIEPPRLLDLRVEGGSFQAINRLHVPVPHRNLVLLSLALSWASTLGCTQLAIGLNRDDFRKDAEFQAAGAVRYTTGTRAFVERFRSLAEAVAPDVELVLPQQDLTKAEVVRLGVQLGVPLDRTYSCMRGRARHCGTCLQCTARRAAFLDAGVPESEAFYENAQVEVSTTT